MSTFSILARVSTTGSNPPSESGTETNVPSGIASGYEECWVANVGTDENGVKKLKDYAEASVQLKAVAQSGVNPLDNVTVRAIDKGTYTKAAGDVLYMGYQNADTLADTGATNVDFTINVY